MGGGGGVLLCCPRDFWDRDCHVHVLLTLFSITWISRLLSFPMPSSHVVRGRQYCRGRWGKWDVGAGNCHPTGMGTLQWQPVRTGWVHSTLDVPTHFVFMLCSLPHGHCLSVGVGSRRGAREGVARCRLPLAQDHFVLWCNQHSLILFDYFFFFFAPFCCCYFSCFHRVGSFLPPSLPGSPFPCDTPET